MGALVKFGSLDTSGKEAAKKAGGRFGFSPGH
jgi:hypothetical protein